MEAEVKERFEHAVLLVLEAEGGDEPKNAWVSRSCKETEFPWSLQKECRPAGILIPVQGDRYQSCKMIKCVCVYFICLFF